MQVVCPVFHVPPDRCMWCWHGEDEEGWENEQTLHAEALTRDWSFGLAADRYEAWLCSCSDHADVLNSGPRL